MRYVSGRKLQCLLGYVVRSTTRLDLLYLDPTIESLPAEVRATPKTLHHPAHIVSDGTSGIGRVP
jgi:hypothetical protein